MVRGRWGGEGEGIVTLASHGIYKRTEFLHELVCCR